jgi:DNA processing protein
MTDTEELAGWIRLMDTEGIGPQTARELLGRFGLPSDIFGAGFSALQKCVPEKIAYALCAPVSDALQTKIDHTLAWAAQPENHLLTLADHNYPKSLLTITDPPPVLYAKGQVSLLTRPSIAIVGSRNATQQGMENAERFAQVLSAAGLTVISGMALGIDACAHQGALRHAPSAHGGGSTVAVTGTGLDLVYPARHRELAHKIADAGCLLSEYPLSTPAIASNFPRRNRIISGLSLGVLVVEAAAQSGSLITARSALEQGREVFAIPGSIHSPLSKGCHLLIRQGAKLVESAQDILEELRWEPDKLPDPAPAPVPRGDPALDPLLEAAGYDPVSVDQLVQRSNLSAAEVQAGLLTLELNGKIELLPGGHYRRLGKI